MCSKDRHHAVDGASLGRTNWIKSRTGLGQVLLRMPLGPYIPLCVFSAGALLPWGTCCKPGGARVEPRGWKSDQPPVWARGILEFSQEIPAHQAQALSEVFCFFFFFFKLYITVLVLPNIKMNPPQVYMCSPSWTLHPSGSSQCTSPKHPLSCIEPGLATHFIHDILHDSMPFSQIFPPSPSPTESIRLFYTSVSLLLSRTQGYCYHFSKFHIYALVYCIGVFLSGLLHSV